MLQPLNSFLYTIFLGRIILCHFKILYPYIKSLIEVCMLQGYSKIVIGVSKLGIEVYDHIEILDGRIILTKGTVSHPPGEGKR